ncbi:unnamed protein product [Heligmosomoides polygyrus]|uniref:Reverse transcriptase domain-containing protein n=1 Tax=Heligmosomoides polygyrus TaxID=6339 RepID=A0A183GSL8_HELPZ|nr:unnamed protein product [Heligmosomoides polygyrus]
MTRTARLGTGSQVSIIPLQMLVDALQARYDLNADVEEIDLDRSKAVYDASGNPMSFKGNPMSFKGAVGLAIQVNKGTRHRIDLFVQAGDDDLIVLGTNALEELGWSLPPNVQSSRGRTGSSGRRHSPEEAKDVSLCCDDMKQDGVLRSSSEILPDAEGRVPEAVSLQQPEVKRASRKARLGIPEASEESEKKRKRMIKKEPVGRSTLARENAQLSLSKVDGNEVDYVKTAMGEVRAELTRHLSELERRLETIVCCHYSVVLKTLTNTHPANCREVDLRYRQTALTGRQVVECLDKVRQKIGDVLKVGKFEAASTEQKRRRRQDKAARARRRRGEYRPSLSVMPDQERPRREITFVERHPCGVVQAHGALGNPRKRGTTNGRENHRDYHTLAEEGPRAVDAIARGIVGSAESGRSSLKGRHVKNGRGARPRSSDLCCVFVYL